MTAEIRERSAQVGEATFGLLECGPADGPLVICLHGFPDTAWSWRHLLPELADAGFRGVAPYLRGYAPTSLSPDGRYPLARLVKDVILLHDHFGAPPGASLVGHDWGAAVSYGAAALAPERFRRVVGMAVPPAAAFVQGLLRFEQLRRSFYVFFFQTAFAEGVVAADGMAFLERLWDAWSPGYDATEDLERVRTSLGTPKNLAAAIGYYRAMFDFGAPSEGLEAEVAASLAAVTQPTLYLHGRRDGCVGVDTIEDPGVMATLSGLLGPGSEVAVIDEGGHFLHLEVPEVVNPRVLDWLRDGGGAS